MSDRPSFTVYCDEAGNTGPQYLDAKQPVFALSGLVVPLEKHADVVRAVERVRDRFKRPKQNLPAELKSSKLMESARGRENLLTFLQEILSLGVIPAYVIAEKRYCAAAKLVETFFDPEHNPAASWLPTNDNIARPKLAGAVAEYRTEALDGFVEWFRAPTADALPSVLATLIEEASWANHSAVRTTLCALRDDPASIASVVEAETYVNEEPGGRAPGISINIPAFQMLLENIDSFVASQGQTAAVVHDETASFERALTHWFTKLDGISPLEVHGLLRDGQAFRLGFRALSGFTISKFEKDAALAAADFVAGLVFALGKGALGAPYASCRHLAAARSLLMPILLTGVAGFFGAGPFMRAFAGGRDENMALLDQMKKARERRP